MASSGTTTPRRPEPAASYRVSHASPGRLRVRYPPRWLRARQPALESRLRELDGVRAVTGSSVTGSLLISYDPFSLAERLLIGELETMTAVLDGAPGGATPPDRAGDGEPGPAREPVTRGAMPVLPLLGATAALAGTCLAIPGPAMAALILASDLPALTRAVNALRRRRVDGNVLEASALLLLLARGHWTAPALLSWLRALGEYIVAKSVVTTRRSLFGLVAEPGRRVKRVEGTRRRSVAASAVAPRDVIVVSSGERVPVDGDIVGGEALLNQQTVTGEALPVERQPGDTVFAGTVVEAGEIEVRVSRVGLDTAVGRILEAVDAAVRQKSDIQRLVERLADRDVVRTLVLAGLGAAFSRSLDAATAIMVADYGLAARVGIPTAMLTSIKQASRAGILVKGPSALENLARVDTVVFDKTGTLTSGAPRIARIVTYTRGLTDRELLRLVAAAEHGFAHPVARAIARLAAEQGVRPPRAARAVETVGLGVEVQIEGRRVLIGSRRLMESRGIALRAASGDEAGAHAAGAAPAFVAVDGDLAGLLVLEDELRAEAPAAVLALRQRQMRNVIMLSGDHPEPSRVIAESLGLRHHYADVLPEDKARLIRELKAQGRVVAMVGDGVNDALALSEADVGVAVPGGAPVTIEAADVVLLRGGLDRFVWALDLSRGAMAGVRRTLTVASQANLAVVGLASFGWARPLTSIVLSHGSTVATAVILAARPGLTLPPPDGAAG